MDCFTVMSTFVAVARTRSFTAAADARGISRALVSRHIADLEARVGVRLVNRTTRSVNLTEAGEQHFEFCARVLRELEEQESQLARSREKAEGPLAILSPKWIGTLDLADAVAQFCAEYPAIKVKFELADRTGRVFDFVENGFDLAFQTKNIRDSGLIVRKVASLKFALCAAPSYIANHGRPVSLKDLARHDCLVHVNEPTWQFSSQRQKAHQKIQRVGFSSNTYLALERAAVAGLGVAMLPLRSAAPEIAAGNLDVLLPDHPIPERPLYVGHAQGHQKIKRIRCFIDFMGRWFKRHPSANATSRNAGANTAAPLKLAN